MSKVIKNTEGFIPEEFIVNDFEKSPDWGNSPKPTSSDTPIDKRSNIPSVTDLLQKQDDSSDNQTKIDPYANDFSAPVTTSNEIIKEEDTVLNAEINEEDEQDKNVLADLEALAEEHYNRGVQVGMERVESDYGLSIKTLQSICEQLNSIRETILKNSLDEMRDLVLQISEKIIRQSVANQKQTIIQTVEDAIQKAVKSDEFIISVNPDDYVTIKTRSADFINSISGLENIIVRSDGAIEEGGCLIESSNCTVDATLVSQLDIIAKSLKEQH